MINKKREYKKQNNTEKKQTDGVLKTWQKKYVQNRLNNLGASW